MTDRSLFEAGAAALRFNAPLSGTRAIHLADAVLTTRPAVVVDFGCGRAELLLEIVDRGGEDVRGVGVDLDEKALTAARQNAVARNVSDRVSFVASEATAFGDRADIAISVGASHAFGGLRPMLQHFDAPRAVVGDAFWAASPDEWCVDTFGELPSSLSGIATVAEGTGWRVVEQDASTLDEWDAFEAGWCRGVAAVGTPAAASLATSRAEEYHDHYRGVLGFAWLVLARGEGLAP
jgi:SAM-dependent methyltransferase